MPAEDVWVSRSTDGGDTWSSPRNVSQSDTLSIFPSLTLDEQGKRQIVWQEHRGSGSTWEGYEIYYWCDWVNHTVYLPLVQKSDSR